MNLKRIGLLALVGTVISAFAGMANAGAPVAKLVQIKGDVEYSRNGTSWKPVTRTKYLFEGYMIKTGPDGSGKIINQSTGMTRDLGAGTKIAVLADAVELVDGNLTEPKKDSGSIFVGLANKFATAQRYTTVRRSVTKASDGECDNKVRTIRAVSVSAAYPELVWRNACPEYSYRIVIDGESHEVAAQSTSEMIRYTISDATVGEHSYHVEVLDKDGTVYIPRGESTFVWLDNKAEKAVMSSVGDVQDDVFMVASVLEEQNMFVAAMDRYREYFNENPDDNDMRPLLIQSYQDLKLSNLRESEARLYNASLEGNY
jgi:hypothetical protein